jgi:hypothetical protein
VNEGAKMEREHEAAFAALRLRQLRRTRNVSTQVDLICRDSSAEREVFVMQGRGDQDGIDDLERINDVLMCDVTENKIAVDALNKKGEKDRKTIARLTADGRTARTTTRQMESTLDASQRECTQLHSNVDAGVKKMNRTLELLREEITIQGRELGRVSIDRDRFVAKETQLFATVEQTIAKLEQKSPARFDWTLQTQ